MAATNQTPHATAQLRLQKPVINIPSAYQSYLLSGQLWQGEVQLHGKKWWVGGAEQHLATPTSPRNLAWLFLQLAEPTNAPNHSPAWCLSPVQHFFLNDHSYRVSWTYDQPGPETRLSLAFYEETPALAQLKIEGNDIRRLQFHGKQAVLVENPGPIVQLPVDTYPQVQVTVGKSNQVARFDTYLNQAFSISRDKLNVLNAGGPLTNHIDGSWKGRSLRLDYQLLGACGHIYRPAELSQPPRFSIRLNGQPFSAGDFQYG
jgi:hypothetical protein